MHHAQDRLVRLNGLSLLARILIQGNEAQPAKKEAALDRRTALEGN